MTAGVPSSHSQPDPSQLRHPQRASTPLAGTWCSSAPSAARPWGQARGLEKHRPQSHAGLRGQGDTGLTATGPEDPPRGAGHPATGVSLRRVGAAQTGAHVSVTRGLRAVAEGHWMATSIGKTNTAFHVPLVVTVTRRTAKPCDPGARARQSTHGSTHTSRHGLYAPRATASHAGPRGRRHAL